MDSRTILAGIVIVGLIAVSMGGAFPKIANASDHTTTDVIVTTPETGPQIHVLVKYPFRRVEVSIDMPSPPEKQRVTRESGVAFTGLQVLPATTDNFWITANVSANWTSLDSEQGIPALHDSVIGIQPLQYIDLESNLSGGDVGGATVEFAVQKSRINGFGANASDVVLFQYESSQWLPVRTSQIEETLTTYRYRADTTGLSLFAVGVNRPEFTIIDVSVSENAVRVDERVDIAVEVNNIGRAAGTYTVNLQMDGQSVDQQSVRIAAGGKKTVIFNRRVVSPGQAVFSVEGNSVEVSVEPTPTAAKTVSPTATRPGTPPPITHALVQTTAGGTSRSPGLAGFTAVLALLAVMTIALISRLRIRR